MSQFTYSNGVVVEVEVVNENPQNEKDIRISGALVQALSFENQIDTQVDESGNTWFNAKDVSESLGYNTSNVKRILNQNTNEKDRSVRATLTKGGNQKVNFVNESGLYSLIINSKLPKAQEFRHWVTNDVLPSIRKTGSYSVSGKITSVEIKEASDVFKSVFSIMETIGCSLNESALTAAAEAKSLTGYDVARLIPQRLLTVVEEEGKHPISDYYNKDRTLGAKANKVLESLGYIKKVNKAWIPTPKGRDFGIVQITSKPNEGSRTVVVCHYPSTVKEILDGLV